MTDNTMTINFTGSIQEFTALLEKHSLSGFRFTAQVSVELGAAADPDVIEQLNACPNGISAIKMYRDMTQCSLKEAKDFVVANCRDAFPNLY